MFNGKETDTKGEVPVLSNLQMQALMGEFRRMMRGELDQLHERLDRVEDRTQRGQNERGVPQIGPNVPRRNRVQEEEYEGEGYEEEFDRLTVDGHRRYGRDREIRNMGDSNLGGIKMKIPAFQGKSDPEAYLEWEKKIE